MRTCILINMNYAQNGVGDGGLWYFCSLASYLHSCVDHMSVLAQWEHTLKLKVKLTLFSFIFERKYVCLKHASVIRMCSKKKLKVNLFQQRVFYLAL